ncbi:hypothetical protein HMPREF3226_02696 [Prevotella corporis]|uniref:Uncharacterized protein n=1 Tax=Prevotella corporis TaxID=28128 RepID=A0A133PTP7_9BACT|nr:hypothetical protein HMPREF3226_02696 [Prevotella corporis]
MWQSYKKKYIKDNFLSKKHFLFLFLSYFYLVLSLCNYHFVKFTLQLRLFFSTSTMKQLIP